MSDARDGFAELTESVLNVLRHTKSNRRVTAKQIADACQTTGPMVRRVINKLRQAGYLICADSSKNKGYWIAETFAEAVEWLESNRGRIVEQLRAHNGFKRAARRKYLAGWSGKVEQGRLF